MHILIRSAKEQKDILLEKNISPELEISWFENEIVDADCYLDLLFETEEPIFESICNKPVIVNSAIKPCNKLPENYCRINGWNGFLEKELLETATNNVKLQPVFKLILENLGFKPTFVADIIGFVSLRAIAMIINEAYFGLEDEISSKTDIDTAMKLGTNYPYGPFEWGEKIGLKNISNLLIELAKTDSRYQPCTWLLREAGLSF